MARIKKRTKITLIVLGCVLLLFLIAVIVCTQSTALYAGSVCKELNHMSVMSSIENIEVANPRVVDLAMLGAHDANTYNLPKQAPTSGDVNKTLKTLYPLAVGVAYRYTKTQMSDIYTQLACGTRFVHIKCANVDGEWHGSHVLVGERVDFYVKEIIKFLSETTGEIVTMNFQLAYGENATLTGFTEYVLHIKYNGMTLNDFVPYKDISLKNLRYNDITLNGTKSGAVVVVTRGKAFTDDELWNLDESVESYNKCYIGWKRIYNKWANSMKCSTIAAALDEKCLDIDKAPDYYKKSFRMMQIQATPNTTDWFDTACAWSLVANAKGHNTEMLNNENFDNWMAHMPIVLCDFVTSSNGNFNEKINQKILDYNTNLVQSMLPSE